jgi:ankyrin repeat protein
MLAAMEGNSQIGAALTARGANINLANEFGDTALSLAAHAGHLKMTRWLMSVGASTDCRPLGHEMATWIKISSGLPPDKLAEVLTAIGHEEHLH